MKLKQIFSYLILLLPIIGAAQHAVEWEDLVNLNYNSSTKRITKTGSSSWRNSRAISKNVLDRGKDGSVKYTVSKLGDNKFVGLAEYNNVNFFRSIDYAFHQNPNSLYIYEKGQNRGVFGGYQLGDVLEIKRTGNVIQYFKNGTVLRTVGTNNNRLLYVDVNIHTTNGYYTGITTSFQPLPLQEELI